MEQLLEWLRSALDDPQKLLVRLGVLWWIYSSIRSALRRRAQGSEAQSEPESQGQAPSPEPSAPKPPPKRRPEAQPAAGRLAERVGERARAAIARAQAAQAAQAEGRRRSLAPKASARPKPEASPSAARATATSEARATLDAALTRTHAVRTRIRGEDRLARLEPILGAEVQEPLQRARAQVSSPQSVGPDGAGAAELAASALRALELIARLVAERGREDPLLLEREIAAEGGTRELERAQRSERHRQAEPLFVADAIVEAVHAPLRQYADVKGLPLRGRHPFAIRLPLPASARSLHDQVLLVPLSRDFGAQLDDYVELLHALGSRWFFAFPRFAQDCNTQLDLSQRVRLPDPRTGYTEASVRACFGPWLPALFADLVLTLRLGEGYVAGLVHSTAESSEVVRARSEGDQLSHVPPVVLRVQVALLALTRLGRQRSAERLRDAFAAAHPALEQSFLPLADGRLMVVPTAYLLAITQPLAQFLLDTPHPALGGVPLAELPIVQSLEHARQQERLSARLSAGPLAERVDPAELVGAALLAWQAGVSAEPLLVRMHAALAPPRGRGVQPQPADRALLAGARAAAGRPQSLRSAFRDPRTLRSAVVLGAAFESSRGRHNRL